MTTVRMQAVIVAAQGSKGVEIRASPTEEPSGDYYLRTSIVSPSTESTAITTTTVASAALRETFSSVPVVSRQELASQYHDVAQALAELTELQEGDDWKIDPTVYRVAHHVAAELLSYSFPPPQVFTHGPKSIVFNWTREPNNLYLTVSADRISALVSTPERIKRRLEFSAKGLLNPAAVFPALQSAQTEQPVPVNEAVSDE